ncbi:oligosaccharide flippase family protein [Maribellus comscasis]|uniref:Oligosaccharide flippase family protein n=1 Tax=Maribellus comscasis TaxID=2681766 RepID=A0A6I6JPR4_9BACT|nr:polysaccharide biosynthesis C-terminal domain-containing protein [Maribellus comscasis]QGY44441.1 oligosaccharide flippase family protein [Maribellus comscasis]
MGIIAKQTIKGSIWSYLGVVVGFVTTIYLYTEYLTPEVVGLFGLLAAISTIASSLSSLGMNGVTNRLFPYFRDKSSGNNGYLFVNLIPQMVGFIMFFLFFIFYRNSLIDNNIEKSALFAEYVDLIIPISFSFLLFNALDSYLKLLYNAVFGTFLQEFLQRFLIFLSVILYVFKLIGFQQLIIAYMIAVSAKAVILVIFLWRKGELNLRPVSGFITPKLRKEMIDVALFSIVGGLGSMIVFNIDKIVVNQLLDLSNTGVYTIAFYFGTLVIIPSRPLLKITGTLIADAWKENDVETIGNLYYKSCLNQFIIGGFLFLGIWANIDNILTILGPDYAASKWVIFFIGLGYLIDMLTGANGLIIQYSKYYRVALVFIVILVVIVLILLYSLIPLWGITGAAIAIAAALFLNNLMRFIFLFKKFKLQPFNYNFLIVAVFYFILYFLIRFIPEQMLILDLFLRGGGIVLASIVFFSVVPVSEELKQVRSFFNF